jgi:cytochrome c peroxidase
MRLKPTIEFDLLNYLIVIFSWLLFSPLVEGADDAQWLTKDCPVGFNTKGGLCYYASPYVTEVGKGLATGFKPDKDGLDPLKISLGKLLFFDPLLSGDEDVSCAHCHQPYKGFADGLDHRVGRQGTKLKRSAPSLWNTAFRKSWFWDGRAHSLEQQVLGPIESPDEMGASVELVEQKLNTHDVYKKLFKIVFSSQPITIGQVQESIAEFERTLVSLDAPFDRYARGDHTALTKEQVAGFNVFRSFVARCPECHTPPLFQNHQFAVLGVKPTKGVIDEGVAEIFEDKRYDRAFMVPTLRNINRTSPYMHNGSLKSLTEVVQFYNEGGGRGSRGEYVDRIHWHVRPMGLSPREIDQVVVFLDSLTDVSALPLIPKRVPSGLAVFTGDTTHASH